MGQSSPYVLRGPSPPLGCDGSVRPYPFQVSPGSGSKGSDHFFRRPPGLRWVSPALLLTGASQNMEVLWVSPALPRWDCGG
ncbi:hypothetical protein FKM82_029890 [Ascaphus truei]